MGNEHLTIFNEGALARALIRLQESPMPADFCAAVDELATDPASTFRMEWDFGAAKVPPLGVRQQGQSRRADLEAENAIKVFEYVGDMSPVQASDRRLWSYLSIVTFADYTRARWNLDNDRAWQRRVARRWLMPRGSRDELIRNSVARLWWAAKLTRDPQRLRPLASARNDEYAYLRLALEKEDKFIAIFDRDAGMIPELRFALLEHFAEGEDVDEAYVRALMIEVVLVTGYRELAGLTREQLREVVSSAASRLS